MEEKTFRKILRQVLERSIPSQTDPWHVIHAHLAARKALDLNVVLKATGIFHNRRIRQAAAALLIVLVAATVILATPQIRAWAQNTLHMVGGSQPTLTPNSPTLALADQLTPTVPPPTLTPMSDQLPTLSPTMETPQPIIENLSVEEAEALAGFRVPLPDKLPKGYRFDHASYSADLKTICLSYIPDLHIAVSVPAHLPNSGKLSPLIPHLLTPKTVEVPVGGAVDGMGLYAEGEVEPNNFCGSQAERKELLARTESMQFSIFSFEDDGYIINFLTRQEMVKLAESMTGVHTISDDQLDPEYLLSVKDADSVAGFHIKLPTLLPQDHKFHHIRVTQDGRLKTVTIFYTRGLVISQTTGITETLEEIFLRASDADIVSVRSQPGLFYQGFYDCDPDFKKCVHIKMENGGDGSISLIWFEDRIQYRIGAMNELGFTKTFWLAIAESMK